MQERERSAARREQNEKLVAEKEQARVEQEQALAEARAALEELAARCRPVVRRAFGVTRGTRGSRRTAARRAVRSSALENQIREIAHRRQQLTQELERLGVEKARLLSDNIELDSRAAELAKHIADGDAVANELAGAGGERPLGTRCRGRVAADFAPGDAGCFGPPLA